VIPHNKAVLEMDGQEIELQIRANEHMYETVRAAEDYHRALQYRIMIDKLRDAKQKFHEKHAKVFAERYGINIQIHIGGQGGK